MLLLFIITINSSRDYHYDNVRKKCKYDIVTLTIVTPTIISAMYFT